MFKICNSCGKEYKTEDKRSKFCSKECNYSNRPNNKIIVKCDFCGKDVKIFPCRLIIKHHFCSRECQANWQALYRRGRNGATWNGSRLGRVCEYCRRTYKPQNSIARFCCDRCRILDLTERQYGKDNPSWKGGITKGRRKFEGMAEYQEWKLFVYKNDKYRCAICGNTKTLNAHHIKSLGNYPELWVDKNNGITLCKNCHLKTYGKEPLFENYFYMIRDFLEEFKEKEVRIALKEF